MINNSNNDNNHNNNDENENENLNSYKSVKAINQNKKSVQVKAVRVYLNGEKRSESHVLLERKSRKM